MARQGRTQAPAHRSKVRVKSSKKRSLDLAKTRLQVVSLFFTMCFLIIGGRVVDVTILRSELYAGNLAHESKEAPLSTFRHDIKDRNGILLATTIETASLFANPRILKHPKQTARKLDKLLPDVSYLTLLKKLKADRSFIWLAHDLTPTQQHAINALGIPGLNFETGQRRIYPQGHLFSHLLGYVSRDNRGLAGVERTFQAQLTKQDKNGLTLSVDARVQDIVREELARMRKKFKAKAASGVVLDVKTGEILALANLPDFDPHKPASYSAEAKFNRATLGAYELGSTMKSFAVAALLDHGLANILSGYDTRKPIKVSGHTVRDYHPKKRKLSVSEVFTYSSNIGTAKMAQDLGIEKQRDFLRDLGVFEKIELELPERAKPIVPSRWRELTGVTISYGHGIAITPLHLVKATASMVNGGFQAPLTLLKEGNEGKQAKRLLSAKNADRMRYLMRMVVKHGTASKAEAKGYRVGGKTGTAEKPDERGRYDDNKLISSFVAAFPMDDPHYLIFTMFDEPQGRKDTFGYATAGWTAAPTTKAIVERMAPMLGVEPKYEIPNDPVDYYWEKAYKRFGDAD
jgi:cell division protein FtsI (penicillin-binding protein 3)